LILEFNKIACRSDDGSVDIIQLPNMNVITHLNPKLDWLSSLCVTKDNYIFGFEKGIAKYTKEFHDPVIYKSKADVLSIFASSHNARDILILGELGNNIEVIDSNSLVLLTYF
jgi:hypothetical protein